MSYHFRPATKTSAKLLLGLFSESGRGKTYSSLLLARGFVGPKGRIGMIETESGRGEIYIDAIPGGYEVCPITGDFSPKTYGEAISVAEAEKFDALIVDSASHEWEGLGGVLDMAAQNQAEGKKGVLVWQKPKMDHQKHFILRLMQTPIPLVIVNMRAKYPMIETMVEKKGQMVKEWVRSKDLEPKQSEDILFEMLAHGWIDEEHRLHVTKYPKADPTFQGVLKDGDPITYETGKRLAEWSHGRAKEKAPEQAADMPDSAAPKAEGDGFITPDQVATLETMCQDAGIMLPRFKHAAQVERLAQIRAINYTRALDWIKKATTKD